MKKRLVVLFMVLVVLFTLVPSTNAYAEVAGINDENFEDNYKYSVLNLHWNFSIEDVITETEEETMSILTYYSASSSVFYIGNGYFVTAAHCVKELGDKEHYGDRYSATIAGSEEELEEEDGVIVIDIGFGYGDEGISLELVAFDKNKDLAILKTEEDVDDLVPIKIAEDYSNYYSKTVYNVGWPGGDKYAYKEYMVLYKESVTMGDGTYNQFISDTFKLQGSSIGGQSGSPLMNENKEVIAVLSCSNPDNTWATSTEGLFEMIKGIDDENAIALLPDKYKPVVCVDNQNE